MSFTAVCIRHHSHCNYDDTRAVSGYFSSVRYPGRLGFEWGFRTLCIISGLYESQVPKGSNQLPVKCLNAALWTNRTAKPNFTFDRVAKRSWGCSGSSLCSVTAILSGVGRYTLRFKSRIIREKERIGQCRAAGPKQSSTSCWTFQILISWQLQEGKIFYDYFFICSVLFWCWKA